MLLLLYISTNAQEKELAPTPPMGFMTWNFFGVDFNENDIRTMADAMVENGLVDLGYNYIFIDDGWQGGRDNKNNIIADAKKFPSGMKKLADYLHDRGMKLGIYSDAAQFTCAGYTASLGFEEQDAKTFASWDIDYLKYDYCYAPADVRQRNVTKKWQKPYKSQDEILFWLFANGVTESRGSGEQKLEDNFGALPLMSVISGLRTAKGRNYTEQEQVFLTL